jgi:hypothetical protein
MYAGLFGMNIVPPFQTHGDDYGWFNPPFDDAEDG